MKNGSFAKAKKIITMSSRDYVYILTIGDNAPEFFDKLTTLVSVHPECDEVYPVKNWYYHLKKKGVVNWPGVYNGLPPVTCVRQNVITSKNVQKSHDESSG